MFPPISYFPLVANPQGNALHAYHIIYFLTSIPFLAVP